MAYKRNGHLTYWVLEYRADNGTWWPANLHLFEFKKQAEVAIRRYKLDSEGRYRAAKYQRIKEGQ